MPLSCSILTAPSDLEALRPAWDALLAESAADGPMLSPPWLLAWWRAFGADDGRRLAVAAFHEGERLVGLAPLIARTVRHRPGIPFRRLELLGTGEPEADEVCSEHLGILAERGREALVARGLAEALADGALGPWDEIVLAPLDADTPLVPALAAALARVGAPLDITTTDSAYYVELPRSYAEYTAKLSPGSRYLLSRSARDFERWAGGEVAFHEARTPAEVEEGRRVLIALHGERWGGGGAFVSPRFRAFHEEVMAAMFPRGALEVLWVTARGEPFAAAYNLVWRGKVHYYQTGRRVDVPPTVRPGIVLIGHAIARAIAAGRREYDFLQGEQRYKRELATACRTVVRLRAVRRRDGIRERTRALVQGTARAVRGAIRGQAVVTGPYAGGPPAVLTGDLNLLRCFAGTSVRTVVVSPDPDTPSFFSRHCGQRRLCASPAEDEGAFLADLLALGQLHPGRPVLFYGDDALLRLVSRHRQALRERFRFALPPEDLLSALADKGRLATLARELSLPAPPTVLSTEGEEEVYSFHAYREARGRVLGRYVGRKSRVHPRWAGIRTCLEICEAPDLERLGLEVLERLDLRGIVALDVKRDPRDGRYHLVEVNARFSPWNHLGAAAGVNLPLLAYRDLLGIPTAPSPPARAGLRWISFAADTRGFFLAPGSLAPAPRKVA